MTILVLGGAGYIGSHTVKELCDAGENVVVADCLATGHKEAVNKKARFYKGDIRDGACLDEIFTKEKIDVVMHFCAFSLVGESVVDPIKYYDNNMGGAIMLLKKMHEHGLNKIVFSSTAAVYGEPERVPIMENDKTETTNPYGETTVSIEKMFKWASKA